MSPPTGPDAGPSTRSSAGLTSTLAADGRDPS